MKTQSPSEARWKLVLRVEIPGKPIPKARPVRWKGRTFLPSMAYQTTVAEYAVVAMRRIGVRGQSPFPVDGPIRARLRFYFKKPKSRSRAALMDRKPDLDNLVKSILDGLERAGAITNDSRVVSIDAQKDYGDPRAEVELYVRRSSR